MQRLIFQNANLLDGQSPACPNSTVIIKGNRIEHVGSEDSVPAGPGDLVFNLRGRTIMPGMVHCHFHAGYHNIGAVRPVMPVGMDSPIGTQAIRAAKNTELALQCGYTGVVSAGAANGLDYVVAKGIEEGLITGPRFVPCGRDISTTGHSMDLKNLPWWKSSYTGNFNRADGADSMRRAVREEISYGAEIVKLFVTGGHGAGTPPRMEMTAEELKAAIETARERGARSRGHIANSEGITLALKFGIDVVDHGDGLDREGIELFLQKDATLVPSMLYSKKLIEVASPHLVEEMKADFETNMRAFHDANDAGVRMVVGDDHGAFFLPHGTYAEELVFYVRDMGFSALDIIRWATANGAHVLGMGEHIGLLKSGYLADILVVDGDPSKDIGILCDPQNLLAIIKDGSFYKNNLAMLSADYHGEEMNYQ